MICPDLSRTSPAGALLSALFGPYLESQDEALKSYIPFAWQNPGEDRMHGEYFGDMYLATCRAADLSAMGVNAFFGVAPRFRKSRKKSSIRDVVALHVDIDHPNRSALRKLQDFTPSALVWSGHGYYGFWILDAESPQRKHGAALETL